MIYGRLEARLLHLWLLHLWLLHLWLLHLEGGGNLTLIELEKGAIGALLRALLILQDDLLVAHLQNDLRLVGGMALGSMVALLRAAVVISVRLRLLFLDGGDGDRLEAEAAELARV